MIDTALAALLASIVVAAIALLIHRHFARESCEKLQKQFALANEAEKQVHLREMEYLAERNKSEVSHREALIQARFAAFDDGRKQGKSEHELEASIRLADQRNEFAFNQKRNKLLQKPVKNNVRSMSSKQSFSV